jgi:RecA-family ATPase
MSKFLTGFDLHEYLNNPLIGQEAIVEGLIFKDTINIFYSEPACGKSVIAVNMLASMSSGSNVFGHFPMKRPVKCSYLQLEGSRDEQLGRFKEMMNEIKVNLEYICWHDSPISVENLHFQQEMFTELKEFAPEVIFIDSFYCLTSKGLSTEEGFLSVRQLVKQIKDLTGATIIILHHSAKPQYEAGKVVKKDDPFLGSQYLKAFADFMAHLKRDDQGRVIMKTTKAQRNNEGVKQIVLSFNKVNWTVTAIPDETCKSAVGDIIDYLKSAFKKNQDVTYDNIVKNTSYTKRHIRRLKNDGYFNDLCEFVEADGLATVWKLKNKEKLEEVWGRTNSPTF